MDLEFGTLEELYKRLKPALLTKKNELKRSGIEYIKEEYIWNYLTEVKWANSKNLLLYQMVNDILNVPNIRIEKYVKDKMSIRNRNIYFE